jgi:hypothetical protein
MFWKSRQSHSSGRSDLASLRAPLALQIEQELTEDLRRSVQAADWGGLELVLRQLESKQEALGKYAIAAIVNSRAAHSEPTALHFLCGRGDAHKLARRLLALGADPNIPASIVAMRGGLPVADRPTPLFCALASGDIKLTQVLLKHGADVRQKNSLGETPLLFAIRILPPWSASSRSFQSCLLRAGANPASVDFEGISALGELMLQERWAEAEDIAQNAPGKMVVEERVQRRVVERVTQSALLALARADQDVSGIRMVLRCLEKVQDAMGGAFVSAVLNTPLHKGPTLFARLLETGVPRADIVLAEKIGGSLTRQFDTQLRGNAVKGASAFHHVVASNNPELISWALSRVGPWFVQQSIGEQRFSSLHLLYLRNQPANLEAARLLIEAGCDPLAQTSAGQSLYDMAVGVGDIAGIELWTEYMINPYVDSSPVMREMALHDETLQSHKRDFSEYGKMIVALPVLVRGEMKAWAGSEDSPDYLKRCKEYLEAYYVAKEPARWIPNSSAMYRLLPRAMLHKNPASLASIVRAIDTLSDHDQNARGWHPFQAELMTLLAHPGSHAHDGSSPNTDEIGNTVRDLRSNVTLALTSIHRFNNINIFKVAPATVNFWARVGVGSFSFRYQKWDAQGVAVGDNRLMSLFEQFGFTRVQENEGLVSDLGVGYELGAERKERIRDIVAPLGIKFDPNVRIQFYQGCKRAYLPGIGDFILRNSSPFFGPHLLSHPGYFSRIVAGEGLAPSEVNVLRARAIEESFMPVLQSSLYHPASLAVAEMDYLLSHIENVDRELDFWKFDTRRETAWDTIEGVGTVLRGGYFSDGFPALVQHLKRVAAARQGSGEPIPHLAFFSRALPAWRPLPFTDLDGKQYSTLELTPATLELLGKCATSSADRNDFRKDNGRVFQFFQMGLERGAALVIVDGKEVSHDM